MLRDGQWHSYDNECQWMSLDALKVVHRVTPVGTVFNHPLHPWKVGPLDGTRLGQPGQNMVSNLSVRAVTSENEEAHDTITCYESHIRIAEDSGPYE